MTNQYQLPEDWERQLEHKLLRSTDISLRPKAYVCSPCRGASKDEIQCNIRAARFYMYYAMTEMGFLARAPHAFLALLLDDGIPLERAIALNFGQEFIVSHATLLVCGEYISNGMRAEIETALRLNMPIRCFSQDAYGKIEELYMQMQMRDIQVLLHESHHLLAKAPRSLKRLGVI